MLSNEDWPRLSPVDAAGLRAEDRTSEDGDDMAAAFARCFATADGRRVLAELRRVAFCRMFGPDASEATLRHAEGQKQLVAFILSCVRRGGGGDTEINRRPGA